jgi:glycerol-3-phosphate dehydrogenase
VSTTDLLVLGGGVTGLGLARLATRHGLAVTVVDRGDLASGASSASSHLLHGGLRYLEHGAFARVREALAERAAVLRLAPSLASPVRFLAPVRRGDRVGPWRLRAGLALYDLLAGRHRLAARAWTGARGVRALEPALADTGLRGAGLYSDAVVDDAAVAIAVARDAAARGARLLPHTQLVAARPLAAPAGALACELRTHAGERLSLEARQCVVACGAWTDGVRRALTAMLTPGAPDPAPLLAPSRGTHLVYPALTRSHAVVSLARDGRVWFVVPFAGRSLVGTTEVAVDSPVPPAAWSATADEVRYLHTELGRLLPGAGPVQPLAVYAGVRPLLAAPGARGDASREHRVLDEGGWITVAGGKYTTFRLLAREALAAVLRRLGRGGEPITEPAEPLPPPPAAPAPGALGTWAAAEAHALRLTDAMRRRGTLWLGDDGGVAAAPAVADGMAAVLGWDGARRASELEQWEQGVRAEREFLARALATAAPTGGS